MDASTLQGSLKPVGSLKRFVKIRRFLGPLNLPVISNSGPEQDKTALSSSRGIQKRLDQRCTGQASWAVDAHNYVIPDLMFVLEFGERVMEPLSLGHRRGGSGILHSASMCSICEPVIPSEVSARIFGMDFQLLRLERRDAIHIPSAGPCSRSTSGLACCPGAAHENIKGSRSSRKPLICGGCGGPQSLAGKQVARVSLRDPRLEHDVFASESERFKTRLPRKT